MLDIHIVDARQAKRPHLAVRMFHAAFLVAILFGPGLAADSAAMQWAGFVLLILLLAGMAAAQASKRSPRLTIAEARAHLDKLEKEAR